MQWKCRLWLWPSILGSESFGSKSLESISVWISWHFAIWVFHVMELDFLWKCNERKIQLLWVFAEAFGGCLVRFNTVLYCCSVSCFFFSVIDFPFSASFSLLWYWSVALIGIRGQCVLRNVSIANQMSFAIVSLLEACPCPVWKFWVHWQELDNVRSGDTRNDCNGFLVNKACWLM
jgi:hypothetical protein